LEVFAQKMPHDIFVFKYQNEGLVHVDLQLVVRIEELAVTEAASPRWFLVIEAGL
jgi:hypothetical protein